MHFLADIFFRLILADRHSLVESVDRIVAWPILPRTLRLVGSRKIRFPTRSAASVNLVVFPAMLQFCNEQIARTGDRIAA